MDWYAFLFPIGRGKYCLIRSDLEGNTLLRVMGGGREGIGIIETLIDEIRTEQGKIAIGISALGTSFNRTGEKKLWQYLVHKYGHHRYRLVETGDDSMIVGYVPRDGVDFTHRTERACSILLFERNAHKALLSYLGKTQPPFNLLELARLGCSAVAHPGMSRLLCSTGLPPSSQDIERFINASDRGVLYSAVMCRDVLYVLIKTAKTQYGVDKEELHLSYLEMVSAYRQYGQNLGYKIAVMATCSRYDLGFACTNLHARRQIHEVDGNSVTSLVTEEDYVHPLVLQDVS